MSAAAKAPRKANSGQFKKGDDPRRHKFTHEECVAGFWAGLTSYVEKGGDPRNFLRRKMEARGQTFRPVPKSQRGQIPSERAA